MSEANTFAPHDENLLLLRLPDAEAERLRSSLRVVDLEQRQVLYHPEERIRQIYFPLSAITSVLAVMADGDSIEVGTTGNEGFLGVPIALGVDASPLEVICQIPGRALVMDADAFLAEIEQHGELDRRVRRFIQAYLIMTAQTAACNRLHDIEERCARWLLMTHDRAGSDTFPLTHEFLSHMLGVRRAGVTVALGILRRAGLITSTMGQVTVIDRAGLEDASCECYRVVRDEFDGLIG